jgi:hypothetical protein
MWIIDKRRVRHFAEDGDLEDGAGGGAGTATADQWWEPDEFGEEHLPVVSRYKSRQAFNKAFFEQRKAISSQVQPPDPTKLTPEEYASKLKDYRAKAGGITDPSGFKLNWPEDVKGFVEGHLQEQVKEMLEDASAFGLTQAEVDAKVAKLSEAIRVRMQADESARGESEAKKAKALADADKELSDLWQDDKEKNVANAMLAVERLDDTLLFRDNEALSEEERADRGGLLAQDLRKMDPAARNRFLRVFNELHRRLYSESGGHEPAPGQSQNLYNDRLAKAKAQWPNRPTLWDEIARSNMPL